MLTLNGEDFDSWSLQHGYVQVYSDSWIVPFDDAFHRAGVTFHWSRLAVPVLELSTQQPKNRSKLDHDTYCDPELKILKRWVF